MDNRIWRIARRPEGTDFAAALELAEEDFAPLADGNGGFVNSCHTHCEAQGGGFDNFKIGDKTMVAAYTGACAGGADLSWRRRAAAALATRLPPRAEINPARPLRPRSLAPGQHRHGRQGARRRLVVL